MCEPSWGIVKLAFWVYSTEFPLAQTVLLLPLGGLFWASVGFSVLLCALLGSNLGKYPTKCAPTAVCCVISTRNCEILGQKGIFRSIDPVS